MIIDRKFESLDLDDLYKRYPLIERGIIDFCFDAGMKRHQTILNNRIVNQLQKLNKGDKDLDEKYHIIISMADEDY